MYFFIFIRFYVNLFLINIHYGVKLKMRVLNIDCCSRKPMVPIWRQPSQKFILLYTMAALYIVTLWVYWQIKLCEIIDIYNVIFLILIIPRRIPLVS